MLNCRFFKRKEKKEEREKTERSLTPGIGGALRLLHSVRNDDSSCLRLPD